jgi:hypothetical protein
MPSSSSDFPDWELLQARQQAAETAARQALLWRCHALAEQQIARVEFHYAGSGDSGEAVRTIAWDQQNNPVPMLWPLAEELAALADELIPGGYEINQGSQVRLVLDVSHQQIRHEHVWHDQELNSSDLPDAAPWRD